MKRRQALAAVLVYSACAWLWGCTNGPIPTLERTDVPSAFEQPASRGAPLWPEKNWWQGFGSGELASLIDEAQRGNFDLAQAEARLRQADARARQAGAALLPTLSLNGNVNSLYGESHGAWAHETDFAAGLGASYELDFWGKNRDLADSAIAARAASRAERETVALSMTASVATSYFKLLSLRERLAIARINLQDSRDVLRLVERRVRSGFSAPADLSPERANLAAQEAAIPPLEQSALETRDALAILLGRPPEGFDVSASDLTGIAQPAVAPGLPSALLERRPDVAMAQANLVSAHADLAAARAALLPDIALTASSGIQSPALNAAIATLSGTGPSFGLAASLVQIVFDHGKLVAKSDEAKAREEELLAVYRRSAVSAFADVENALGSLNHLGAQEAALRDEVMQAESVLRVAQKRYRAGAVDFLVVLDAQRSLYAARDQLAGIREERLAASVALYKSLGGGWSDSGWSNSASSEPDTAH